MTALRVGVCWLVVSVNVCLAAETGPTFAGSFDPPQNLQTHVALGWNDLGMHCMQSNYAAMCLLPPYNNLWTQVVERGAPPRIVTSGLCLTYRFPSNTTASDKVDFWTHVQALFGAAPPNDIGLTGHGLSGALEWNGQAFEVTGVPITPYEDANPSLVQPYQFARVTVQDSATSAVLDETTFVVPVSVEMHCDRCHHPRTGQTFWDRVVEDHDGTLTKPVLCASCHASNALGTPGKPGVKPLSQSIHEKHGEEFATEDCYACHPGTEAQCLRDIMMQKGYFCTDCHGTMSHVASSIEQGRRPWIDEPKCADCHDAAHHENTGKLFRNSKGHSGMFCCACHNSPHAIMPTVQPRDGVQMLRVQGRSDYLKNCLVCHTAMPLGPGPHGVVTSWRLLRHLDGEIPFDAFSNWSRADANQDGEIDVPDVVQMLNRNL